jgi:hypothetical protein
MNPSRTRALSVAVLASAGALLGACATGPRQGATWAEASLGPASRLLAGRVLVACEAPDFALQRACEDQVAAELRARGAEPLRVPEGIAVQADRALDPQLVPAAAAASARAVFVVSLQPTVSEGGSGLSIGLGGFSVGRGGGAGVGLSAPLGGGGGSWGLAANARVTDVAPNRLVWTTTVSTGAAPTPQAQSAALARAVIEVARAGGLL